VPVAELDAAVDALVDALVAQPAVPLAMTVDALRALGRATSAPEAAWADADILGWALRDQSGSGSPGSCSSYAFSTRLGAFSRHDSVMSSVSSSSSIAGRLTSTVG
jgi:hypothetical protein